MLKYYSNEVGVEVTHFVFVTSLALANIKYE